MRELAPWITDPDPYVYLSDLWLSFDLETTNKNKGDARIAENRIVYGYVRLSTRLQELSGADEFYTIGSVLDLKELEDLFYAADYFVAHNAHFELKWMQRAGINTRHVLPYCTQIGEYVIGGNRTGEKVWPVSLEASLRRYGLRGKESEVSEQIKSGVCPSEIDQKKLALYCRQDVDQTIALSMRQKRILLNDGLLPVFLLRNMFTPVVVDMEIKGMALDPVEVRKADKAYIEELAKRRASLEKTAGALNLNSHPQKQWFMYGDHPKGLKLPYPRDQKKNIRLGKPNKYFPEGAPRSDKEAIQWLLKQKLKKKQRLWTEGISAYTVAYTNWSRYTRKFVEVCDNTLKDEATPILYGGLMQCVTKTHRLASSPQLQNIARKLKKVFCARHDGWFVGQADYDGMEFRIAGELAQDAQVIEDINCERDPHSFSAHIIFGTPWPYNIKTEGTKEERELRNKAKRDTFKPLYGGMSGTPRQVAYYNAFRERYRGVALMQYGWLDECIDKGEFRVITGLKLYFPNTRRTDDGYVTNTGKIFNIPVQQFATADCGPLGATILWHYLWACDLESFLVNYVHDSIVSEVHPDEKEKFTALCHECMTDRMVDAMEKIIDYRITLPITVEVDIKDHWGTNLREEK